MHPFSCKFPLNYVTVEANYIFLTNLPFVCVLKHLRFGLKIFEGKEKKGKKMTFFTILFLLKSKKISKNLMHTPQNALKLHCNRMHEEEQSKKTWK